jgi:hypothetical protein
MRSEKLRGQEELKQDIGSGIKLEDSPLPVQS